MSAAERAKRHMLSRLAAPNSAALILIVYLLLSLVYNVTVPIFEAPDEPQHFMFVKHLADGKGLPVQGEAANSTWAQEGSQPPLYYLAGALLISGIDTDDVDTLLWVNPHANMGVPLKPGNKNIYIHTAHEAFPYRGAVLAVHLLRLFSALLGAGTILGVWATMRLAWPDRPWLAWGAAALTAFMPQFLFITAAVNNDNLVMCLSTWTIYLLMRFWVQPITWRTGLALGALLGAASLAKLSGLGLFPLAALALGIVAWRDETWRRVAGMGLVALVVAILVGGWWYARNWALYGDPTGLNAMLDVFGRRTVTPASLIGEAEGLRISYWAIFGWFNILSAPILYKVLDALTLLAMVGIGAWLWRTRQSLLRSATGYWALLSIAWCLVILAALVRWTGMTSGTQGRLLFPAIGAISGIFVIGLSAWWPRARQRDGDRLVSLMLGGGFFLWALFSPFLTIAPAYARPPITSAIPPSAQPVNITYGDALQLLAYELSQRSASPGEQVSVKTYWRALKPLMADYSIYVHLFGREEPEGEPQRLAQLDTYPGNGTYPTSLWQPGEIVVDRYTLSVSPTAITPTLARLEIGPYDFATKATLGPIADGDGRTILSPQVATLRIATSHAPRYKIAHPLNIAFDDGITLLGYGADKDTVRPGDEMRVTLYWQAGQRSPRQSYTVFVHLVPATGGEMAGQHDGLPVNGHYPTDVWAAGETVEDVHVIPIKVDAHAGDYRLIVGLYDLATGVRLPVAGGGDHAVLAQIKISW